MNSYHELISEIPSKRIQRGSNFIKYKLLSSFLQRTNLRPFDYGRMSESDNNILSSEIIILQLTRKIEYNINIINS